ncbi:MAG: metal ABC transporter substrate-binding protein [Sulfurimonas sp.]|nr:metal ABC transporter substrate-binding protein [Sulfurimonas sp.]
MNLKNTIFILIILFFLFQIVVSKEDSKQEKEKSKPNVVVSTFALYDSAKYIAGDSLNISMILPFGADAHNFELTPKIMSKIEDSSLFVFSGASLEPWIARIPSKNSVDMSKHVKLITLTGGGCDDENHKDHKNHYNENFVDPHYWLDLKNMINITKVLQEEFTKILPKNKELFQKNADKRIDTLSRLDEKYKQQFNSCKKNVIVVNHNAFSYLSKNYGFEVEALSGLSPQMIPSPKNIKHIHEAIKEHNITTIFFESFVSDKIIKSIAKDLDIKVDVLQPLGNITKDEVGKSYIDIMDTNIQKITKALECK